MTDAHDPADTPTPETPATPVPTPPKPPTPPVPPEPEKRTDQAPMVAASPADDVPIEETRRKSPIAAALLNLIPFGLGHLYVGQYGRATMFFGAIWVSGLVLEQWLLFVFFYFLAIFDAFRQAQLANLDDEGETTAPSVQGPLAFGIFLVVVGAVLLLQNWYDFYAVKRFLQEWWPALLIVSGLWFIVAAIRERTRPKPDDDFDVE